MNMRLFMRMWYQQHYLTLVFKPKLNFADARDDVYILKLRGKYG